MDQLRIVVMALAVLLILFLVQASATDLRGRLDGWYPNSRPFPLPGACVDLFQRQVNGEWIHMGFVLSGPDGMYYMPNISPGDYMLLINKKDRYPLPVQPMPMQDIPPILLKFRK